MPKEYPIKIFLDKAFQNYEQISEIHQKLLKYGYNKPFTVYLKELQARLTYKKIFRNKKV